MRLGIALGFLLAASFARGADAAQPPEPKKRVLVLDLKDEGVGPEVARLVGETLTVRMSGRPTLEVLSSEDVRRMVDVEAEKQMAGCNDDASCLAEIAAALGGDFVVYGTAGKLGTLHVVHLHAYDSRRARPVGREVVEATRPEELPAHVRAAADRLVVAIDPTAPPPQPVVVDDDMPSPSPLASPFLWGGAVGAGLGVAALVVGGAGALVLDGVAGDDSGATRGADRLAARDGGRALVVVAATGGLVTIIGAGVAALAFVP